MAIKTDIEDGKQIDITLRVIEIDEWDHDTIARKIQFEDINGAVVDLTVFHNNEVVDFDWQIGEWYLLENALGNEFQDEKQLNPGYDISVTPLESPPSAAENNASAESESANEPVEQPASSASRDTTADTSDVSGSEEFVSGTEVNSNLRPTADGGGELIHQQPLSEGN